MIIQMAIKGISELGQTDAERILSGGIICNWWRKVALLPSAEIPHRLTDRNLDWHQNHYDDPDPLEGGERFGLHTPFISVTAGTVERDTALARNIMHPARDVALRFATNSWKSDGYLFYCYLFVLGRKSVPHQVFSEEVRELNVNTAFSWFQTEGEITAKICIPPAQIEKAEYYEISKVLADIARGQLPKPTTTSMNGLYQPPENIANIRAVLL